MHKSKQEIRTKTSENVLCVPSIISALILLQKRLVWNQAHNNKQGRSRRDDPWIRITRIYTVWEDIWASARQTQNKTCMTSEDSDQPAHRMSLLKPPGYPKRDKREPLPYWVDVQGDLSLCWLHRSYCRFCRALVRMFVSTHILLALSFPEISCVHGWSNALNLSQDLFMISNFKKIFQFPRERGGGGAGEGACNLWVIVVHSLLFAYLFTNKKYKIVFHKLNAIYLSSCHLVHWHAFTLTQLSNPVIPWGHLSLSLRWVCSSFHIPIKKNRVSHVVFVKKGG